MAITTPWAGERGVGADAKLFRKRNRCKMHLIKIYPNVSIRGRRIMSRRVSGRLRQKGLSFEGLGVEEDEAPVAVVVEAAKDVDDVHESVVLVVVADEKRREVLEEVGCDDG